MGSDPKEFSVGWRGFSSETPLSQAGHCLFGEEEWESWSEKLVYHEQSSSLKWSWRLANEKGAWWIEVIRGKYGVEEGGWVSCNPREGFGVGLWKTLRKWGYLVSGRFSYVVGDGKRTKFWKDRWCGDLLLDVALPSLFSRAMEKEAWMGDLWCYEYGGGCWNPIFSRFLMIGRWRMLRIFWAE